MIQRSAVNYSWNTLSTSLDLVVLTPLHPLSSRPMGKISLQVKSESRRDENQYNLLQDRVIVIHDAKVVA